MDLRTSSIALDSITNSRWGIFAQEIDFGRTIATAFRIGTTKQ